MWLAQSRRLAHDLGAVWTSLQDAEGGGGGGGRDELGQSLMRHSRLYRACLGAHIAQLESCAKSRTDPEHLVHGSLPEEAAHAYMRQKTRVAEYHVVWYLCEILHLATTEEESVTTHLLDWMHMTFYPDYSLVRRIEAQTVKVDAGVLAELLTLTQAFVLQGCFREASLCLGIMAQHVQVPVEAKYLQVTAALLLETPLVGPTTAVREFLPRFQTWRAKCIQLMQAAQTDDCRSAARLLSIMSGDEKALQACGCSWLELVMAHLLYVDPGQRRSHLPQLVQRCVVVWRGLSVADLPPYQRILHAVFCDNIVLALKVASAFTQSWFSAHLADLLHHAGALPTATTETTTTTIPEDEEGGGRVDLLLKFVDDLPLSLWPLAAEYLRRLPGAAAQRRGAALLGRVEPASTSDVRALMASAHELNLPSAASDVARRWAVRAWSDGRLAEAAEWAAESGSRELVARMVAAAGELPGGLDKLSSIEASNICSGDKSMEFVEAYGRLRRARQHGRSDEAARQLALLVCQGLAPRQHWISLLASCVALFEEPQALFSAIELRTMSARLESVVALLDPQQQHQDQDLHVVMLALVRCTARALTVK